jgi:hypothetical protein
VLVVGAGVGGSRKPFFWWGAWCEQCEISNARLSTRSSRVKKKKKKKKESVLRAVDMQNSVGFWGRLLGCVKLYVCVCVCACVCASTATSVVVSGSPGK